MQRASFIISPYRAVNRTLRSSRLFMFMAFLFTCLGNQLLFSKSLHGAEFFCPAGDVDCLIAAITEANENGEENTINLAAGTYTLTSVHNQSRFTSGASGLPVITGKTIINGETAASTIIERDSGAPGFFRIFHIGSNGRLTLNRLTVRNGRVSAPAFERGGGILNEGVVTISQSIVSDNVGFVAGGIYNTGAATIVSSSITRNAAGAERGGGMANDGGTMTIGNSTISDNLAMEGGGISNSGSMSIWNTTIAGNFAAGLPGGAGVRSTGMLTITNSTVSGNVVRTRPPTGTFGEAAIVGTGITLQNTIVGLNFLLDSEESGFDCRGPITSLGNNIIGDPRDCGIDLLATDRTGDPGLGDFVDSGAPGTGRFPLLETSQAIDTGNNEVCFSEPAFAIDQLGTPRRGVCDIGAIEFYPLVNDLVAVGNVSTEFDPAAVSGGPAGTFRITAEFTNTSVDSIGHPFVEVVELSGGNLLLNADHGPGGAGARLTSPDSASLVFAPGATEAFEFLIGLQQQEPFTFFVNLLGDPQASNASVATIGEPPSSSP